MRPLPEPDDLELITDTIEELRKRREARGEAGGQGEAGRPVEEARVGELLEEAMLISEGDCFEAVVKEIRFGRFGEFVPPPRDERFKESYERRRDRPAYMFILEGPIGRFKDVIIISAHRNSRMAQLAKCYKKIKVGMKVKVCVENGKPRITC